MSVLGDLKPLVQSKLRETVHGEEFDLYRNEIDIYEMVGSTSADPRGTIMHPSHEFWDDFPEVTTERECFEHVSEAVRVLREEGTFRKEYPHGEEADIVYCEVDPVDTTEATTVVCAECDAPADGSLSFEPCGSKGYNFRLSVDCDHCGHSSEHERLLQRQ